MSDLQNSPPGSNGFYITDASNTPATYAFNTKIMVGAIVVLFLVIFFILMLHVYAKWFLRRSSGSYAISRGIAFSSLAGAASSAQRNTGLDKAAIAQLPTFVYTATSPVDDSEAGKLDESVTRPVLECAVCLSEFQENEKGRMLPVCKHMFHTECIDMWFFSHSTCPLCRANVVPAMASSAETTPTDQHIHQQQEAMEPSQGTAEGNSVTSRAVEFPCNVLFWGNQAQVVSSQEPFTSSLPVSPSLHRAGARALPQITIDIPPIEGNLLVSTSECLSAKCTTEQGASSSQPLKSPGLRASIKRMLSRQSSRHKSPTQEGNEESPK